MTKFASHAEASTQGDYYRAECKRLLRSQRHQTHVRARRVMVVLITLGAVIVGSGQATATHLCLADSVVTGAIWAKWQTLGGRGGSLGCPRTLEADVPGGDGRFNQFEHGQIVWSPHQKMVVAAVETDTRDGIELHWWITDQYQYDAFSIHWIWWENSKLQDKSQDFSHGDPKISTTAGAWTIPKLAGRYQVQVEGCDRHYPLNSTCHQGWSNWATIDVGYLDVTHHADGATPLEPPTTIADARNAAAVLRVDALAASCRGSFGDLGEGFATLAYSRLAIAPELGGPGGTGSLPVNTCDRSITSVDELVKGVNKAILTAKVSGDVGSDVEIAEGAGAGAAPAIVIGGVLGGPLGALGAGAIAGGVGAAACSRSGNYDMTLTGLIPIAFDQYSLLEGKAYHHLLFDLLNQTGGRDKVVTSINACYINIPETENHILSTESSRYLTNQLRWSKYPRDLYPPGSAQYLRDQKIYDNEANGLEDWMLDTLQGLMRNDFHEYNARPYARLTIRALQNLANYAQGTTPGNQKVRNAASLVLDYLAAKFAVSSNGLRRSVPFRRREERVSFPWLYGNQTDEETWYFLEQAPVLVQIDTLAYGHADWGSPGTMVYASTGAYRVPDVILDLMLTSPEGGTLQAFRHEGVEIYASESEFLISGGGRWEDSLPRDQVLGNGSGDTNGQALATILLPTSEGISRGDLIQIQGDNDGHKRSNTCVAKGFACGLNPVVPDILLRRFPTGFQLSSNCAYPVTDPTILAEWLRHGGVAGDLQCPIGPQQPGAGGAGVQQTFVRGGIILSQPQKMLVTAIFDKGANALDIEWRIIDQYSYDRFLVRWDKDGVNIDQKQVNHDDIGASSTSGSFSVPLSSFGSYRVVIEGCDSDAIGQSVCKQSWSSPVVLDFPGAWSCARAVNHWIFVDGSPRCTGARPQGYFAAVYSAPCASGASCKGQRFGFFEAAAPGWRAPPFGLFIQRTLEANASTVFTSDGSNTFHTWDGRSISFTPDHSRDQWGIADMNGGRLLSRAVDAWHLAMGDVVTSNGNGCVIVTNSHLNQALVLDFTQARNPLPSTTVQLPNGKASCTPS